ncbi:glycosyltransferase [uncultured Campylobacter sp.]|uniref:glycosyltransferase n=1 Tax=uncultured Campylobacter sp. TaxID=218934 RepID=UPI0026105B24|nr:glycosyltransferase [uncultured Campylobacter sp.]
MKIAYLCCSRFYGGVEKIVIDSLNELCKSEQAALIVPDRCEFLQRLDARVQIYQYKSRDKRYNPFLFAEIYRFLRSGGFEILHSHGAKAAQIGFVVEKFLNLKLVATKHNDRKAPVFDRVRNVIAASRKVATTINHAAKVIYFGIEPRREFANHEILARCKDAEGAANEALKEIKNARGDSAGAANTSQNRAGSAFASQDTLSGAHMSQDRALDADASQNKTSGVFVSQQGASAAAENFKFNIVAVGRLDKIKGFDLLIRAASELKFDFELKIYGQGGERQNLQNLIDSLKLQDHVRLCGFCDDVAAILSASHLHVISSRKEGFPVILIEGIFYSPVLISTRVGGISEILSEEFLCEAADLGAKIDEIYRTYGKYARAFAQKHAKFKQALTLQNYISSLKNYYEELLCEA